MTRKNIRLRNDDTSYNIIGIQIPFTCGNWECIAPVGLALSVFYQPKHQLTPRVGEKTLVELTLQRGTMSPYTLLSSTHGKKTYFR